jgi:hypothetical protein
MSESKPETRREVLRKSVFVAPVILTLTAVPSFASAASGRLHNDHGHHDHKPKDHGQNDQGRNKHRED